MNKLSFTACLAAFVTCSTFAEEHSDGCVKFMNTGKIYSKELNLLSGSELNSATNSFDYSSYADYVVVFWNPGEASVIEMDAPFFRIDGWGSKGSDRRGARWEVSNCSLYPSWLIQ